MAKRIPVPCLIFLAFALTVSGLLASIAGAAAPLNTEYGIDPNAPSESGERIAGRVSVLNGNMVEVREDLAFPSPNRLGLVFRVFYNSRTSTLGALGYGWSHVYAPKLVTSVTIGSATYLKIIDGTGRSVYFQSSTTGVYPGAFQERTRLQLEGTVYIWYLLDGGKQGFSTEGKLLWLDDPAGNRLTMGYNASNGRLKTVTDTATGRVLTLNYNAQGLLANVKGPVTAAVANGVWVTFGYDSDKNLTSVTYADGSGFTHEYATPTNHNLTRKRNMVSHILGEWSYDADSRCTNYFDPEGKGATISFVSATQRRVTDAYGVVRTYGLATAGERRHVVSMTGPPNPPYHSLNAVQWVYDAASLLSEIHYAGGTVKRFLNYDARGNPGTVVLASGTQAERQIQYAYHPSMNVPLTRTEPSVLAAGNKVTIWDYDNPQAPGDNPNVPNENPTSLLYRIIERGFTRDVSGNTLPSETITTFTYNTKGQVLSANGPLPGSSDTVQFVYSPTTFDLQAVTQPLIGTTELLQYDAAGFPGRLMDVNLQIRNFVYDGRARLREIRYGDGSSRIIHYNTAGFVDWGADEDSVSQTYTYEAAYGRLARTTDMEGNTIDNSYDAQGNPIEASYRTAGGTQTRLKRWSYQHPTYPGLLWKEIQADGTFTQYAYDAAGNLTGLTDPITHITTYGYDPFNRLASVFQPDNMTTRYTYDRHGNLSSVTDPENHQTTYTHDDLGRLVATVSPDTGTTTYAYDEAGNLRWKRDANGVTVELVYDVLNRPTAVNFPACPGLAAYSILYSYDQRTNGKGHLTGVTDPSGTTLFNYSPQGKTRREERDLREPELSPLAAAQPRRARSAHHPSRRQNPRLRKGGVHLPGEPGFYHPERGDQGHCRSNGVPSLRGSLGDGLGQRRVGEHAVRSRRASA